MIHIHKTSRNNRQRNGATTAPGFRVIRYKCKIKGNKKNFITELNIFKSKIFVKELNINTGT